MSQKKPTLLIILDGFGYRKDSTHNAIAQSAMPHLNEWSTTYPHTLLKASGTAVGLLDGMMGNSQVGHLAIGAGRIIKQPLTVILKSIENGSFFENPQLIDSLTILKKSNKRLHIMGLLSDAGIHSQTQLLYASIKAAVSMGITDIIVHAFLDGRDVAPQSAHLYLQQLEDYLKQMGCGIIGSIHGRYYAMDRDHHWDRTQLSYQTITQSQALTNLAWQKSLENNYAQGISDEFIKPTQLTPEAVIQHDDGILFFNIRADRARQLTAAFVDPHFDAFVTKKLPLSCFITPVSYSDTLKTDVLFHFNPISNTLKEVLAQHDKTIFSIAETEKYAHVTYFFAGGRERIFNHEVRILIPSLADKQYDKHPEMSASAITQSVLKSLRKSPKDFYVINYANADMVGHSGNLQATIKAVEFLDTQLQQLYLTVIEIMDGTIYITADHGNAEKMFDDQTQQPCTCHTTNCVPFIMLRKDLEHTHMPLPMAQLSDIAPWILKHMNIPVPDEMKAT